MPPDVAAATPAPTHASATPSWRWHAHNGGLIKYRQPPSINGPPPVGLPLRQKAKGGAAALEGRAGVERAVLGRRL